MADALTPTASGREATMHVGPLGSTLHVLRADAATVEALAGLDWNRAFPRVCLDPVAGLITLMTPSRLHDELAAVLDNLVGLAGGSLGGAVKELRTARLREPGRAAGDRHGTRLRVLRRRERPGLSRSRR